MKPDLKDESVFDGIDLSREPDFICRYCHCLLVDSDVLWDACNKCASEEEGLRI
jgi:hypothetical protein